ncbi:MAG: hypothetical protein GF390_02920 [Candidatus Pacebacteria bacterium]|nr:hypothetical protein [Candidatus Paceibacterota bacterium]
MQKLKNWWQNHRKWLINDIVFPTTIIKVMLLIVGWFSQYFQFSTDYFSLGTSPRPWVFSKIRWLDIWARWDSGWYLHLAKHSYQTANQGDPTSINWAFFPLYPWLIKLSSWLVPTQLRTTETWLILGIIISNLSLLLGLSLLYLLVKQIWKSPQIARLTIWYLLIFPTSFFLGTVYSEAVFFCLAVASFYLAYQQKWFLTALTASLLTLTRPLGILILMPLLWLYAQKKHWQLKKPGWQWLYLALIPLTLLSFFTYAYSQTQSWLAPVQAQQAWKRQLDWPWQALFHSQHFIGYITPLDRVFTWLGVGLSFLGVVILPASLAIYGLLLTIAPLFSNSLLSISRFLTVVFPSFIILAIWGHKHRRLNRLIQVIFLSLQVLLFAAWCQLHWVG